MPPYKIIHESELQQQPEPTPAPEPEPRSLMIVPDPPLTTQAPIETPEQRQAGAARRQAQIEEAKRTHEQSEQRAAQAEADLQQRQAELADAREAHAPMLERLAEKQAAFDDDPSKKNAFLKAKKAADESEADVQRGERLLKKAETALTAARRDAVAACRHLLELETSPARIRDRLDQVHELLLEAMRLRFESRVLRANVETEIRADYARLQQLASAHGFSHRVPDTSRVLDLIDAVDSDAADEFQRRVRPRIRHTSDEQDELLRDALSYAIR